MSERFVRRGSFVIERVVDAPPARVFAAWAEREAKLRWFPANEAAWEFDFRVGGREFYSGRIAGDPSGAVHTWEARYLDIVPLQRIVYAHSARRNDVRTSASVACVEFEAVRSGTRMRFVEQGFFLDGHDQVENREMGTHGLFDALERSLQGR